MKRSYISMVLGTAVAVAASTLVAAQSQTQAQSLGDYARAMKKSKNAPEAKTAAKVYDNDNLPTATTISVVGDSASAVSSADKPSEDQGTDPDGSGKKDGKKPENPLKPGQSAEERQQALNEWKDRMSAQKDKISLLSRELEVLEREQQIKAAEFYANTARRTQNPNGFADDDAKYKKQIADKQKQVDDAKSKLTGMQEEARKSGAPNSITE
jgi:hypothetical protein